MRKKDEKSPYQAPQLKVIDFDLRDVISTSGQLSKGSWDDDGWT